MQRFARKPVVALTTADAVAHGGVVWAYRGSAQHRPEGVAPEEALGVASGSGAGAVSATPWVWVHLNLADLRSRSWIGRLDAPEAVQEIMAESDEHQQVNVADGCLTGMIADRQLHFGAAPQSEAEEVGFIRFAVAGNLLLTGRHVALTSTEAARRAVERGAPLDTVADLFMLLVEQVLETASQRAERHGDRLDAVEDDVLAGRLAGRRPDVIAVRRDAVRAKRQIAGLRSVLHRLETQKLLRSEAWREGIQEHSQRLEALAQGVEAAGERSRLLQEEISAALAERTNRHLHVLSILTALFLPATLVTGIFGMNTKDLPFADSQGGFWWAVLVMLTSGIAAMLVLRRLGVFDDFNRD